MNKKFLFLLTAAAIAAAVFVDAQQVVHVGRGSYASYTPLINCKSTRHAQEWGTYKGDQSAWMQRRKLYINERSGQPIPTNDWWTNLITEQYSGHLWSYPQMVQAESNGVDVQRPSFWITGGTEMKSNTILAVTGEDFQPDSAVADSWHDWDVEFTMNDGDKQMKTTLVHGMPFTWIEMSNLHPIIKLSNSSWTDDSFDKNATVKILDGNGNSLVSGSTLSSFIMNKGDDYYGLFLPKGSKVSIINGNAEITFPDNSKQFVVVAMLNDVKDMATLSDYAYTVPRKTTVSWKYQQAAGKMQTFWNIDGENLLGGQPRMLQGFLPHQYRDTGNDGMLSFNSLTYATPHGLLKMAEGNSFEIDYTFHGMLPYWGVPTDTTGVSNPFDASKMEKMVSFETLHQTFGTDTYWGGKSLTQLALNMMMAREMNDSANFTACRDKLKSALVNWYTWTPGEENTFFARYDRWGGLVGYNTSYDSDTFNDHHFHYGYFTLASALLALVDKDFRDNYGDMARLVAKDYANWDHSDTAFPFFRTFDPWAGHSFAGGMGDGNGNGQESSSEAMQSWGGLYLLGVALGDNAMRDAGIFGWLTEARGTAEYWFDRHQDANADYSVANYHTQTTEGYNIPYTKFKSTYTDATGTQKTMTPPYNSNLTCHGVGWWTYFGWDAIYMQGIQWMPISPALDYLSENKAFAAWDYQRMMQDKLIGGWKESEKNSAGWLGNSGGWGNVCLSYLQRSNPDEAARIFDELYDNANSECSPTSAVGTNGVTYFVTHSHRSHGDLDWTVTADYPTARAFDKNDTKTYQIYNPTDKPLTVTFSTGYSHTVAAHEMFISDDPSRQAVAYTETTAPTVDLRDSVGLENPALGKTCYESGHENAGTVKENATDGDLSTRWGSRHQDNEWIYVDLGKNYQLYKTRIYWEASYASEYKIQVSKDAENWTDVKTVSCSGGTDEQKLGDVEGRYVRIYGLQRSSQYGISLYELQVFGQAVDAAADDVIGLQVTADQDVLKENEPSQLSVRGLTADRKWKAISNSDVQWSTKNGAITANGKFTPNIFGKASATAQYKNISVSQDFAVEEARVAQAFKVTPHNNTIAIPDDKLTLTYTATDQFIDNATKTGAEMKIDESEVSYHVLICKGDTTEATAQQAAYDPSTHTFTANEAATYLIAFKYKDLKDTVTVAAKPFSEFNLALGKPATASSAKEGSAASSTTDGSLTTRWETDWANEKDWIMIDLKAYYDINKVRIFWENACASAYSIDCSMDGENWSSEVSGEGKGNEWTENSVIANDVRYVRINCNTKAMPAYGYSIFEIEVYGTAKRGDVPSSIASIKDNSKSNKAVYNLQGQRVDNGKEKLYLPSGVYISGGKKVVKR